MALLKFAPFSATIHPSFWQQLSSYKIDRLQLSEEAVTVLGHYTPGRSILDRQTGQEVHLGCSVNVDGSSFDAESREGSGGQAAAIPQQNNFSATVTGQLKNFNTIEDFKKADKQAAFDGALQEIWQSILHADDPTEKLASFLVLTFADLKKYRFYYWFAFPALTAKPSWMLADGEGWQPLASGTFDGDAVSSIASQLASRHEARKRCDFFLVRVAGAGGTVEVGEVRDFEPFFADVPAAERIVGFLDPSSNTEAPGWPLRNLLAMLHARFGVDRIKVLRWKDALSSAGGNAGLSLMGEVFLPKTAGEDNTATGNVVLPGGRTISLACQPQRTDLPTGVGWERNAQGKLGPKVADLGPLMDPTRLADQAVDLNLKLMRWRIMPDVQLEKIQATRCLLLGAGTLGCYVARTLLGWGVRNITLVDSSKVSFSNPVRQPLFDFEDCLDGGKPKAQCAADRLKKIYPGVNATGHLLNIPMPGHPVPPSSMEQVKADVAQLEGLIASHDVVYLLMDSRESRWLPTVIGASQSKLVMNAALGFDTYLVMRHGAPPPAPSTSTGAVSDSALAPWRRRLGCYFCNDVVAPTDSLTDRTLDQMCTVTRPGLAAIAGASAVELMVSVVQHSKGLNAPAPPPPGMEAKTAEDEEEEARGGSKTSLGVVPHQLRGFLARFNMLPVVGQAYDRCTACSATVIDAYRTQGWDMLERAFGDDGYLEKLTGLDQMYKEVEEMEAALDWEEDEDDEGEL